MTGRIPRIPVDTDATLGNNAKLEAYGQLHGEGQFGRKTLAVSYGGSIELFGRKGVRPSLRRDPSSNDAHPRECMIPSPEQQFDPAAWAAGSGTSWARLDADALKGQTSLTLDRSVDWAAGDKVVLTTTDWHPSHSELLTLADVTDEQLMLADATDHAHEGQIFAIDTTQLSHDPGHQNKQVDLRAAVGLLSRSIQVSRSGLANVNAAVPGRFRRRRNAGRPRQRPGTPTATSAGT